MLLTNSEKRLAKLHRLSIFNHDFRDDTAGFGLDFVHHFHCLDDTDHAVLIHRRANIDKGRRFGDAPR